MVTAEEVQETLGASSYNVELDDAYKYRNFPRGTSFQCKHCKAAFSVNPNEMWVYRFIEKPYDYVVAGIRLHCEEDTERHAICTECPSCKHHIAAWWY
jgi:DNA-directed RNA polymerase subunit M/transcription elongation factor TFIIS